MSGRTSFSLRRIRSAAANDQVVPAARRARNGPRSVGPMLSTIIRSTMWPRVLALHSASTTASSPPASRYLSWTTGLRRARRRYAVASGRSGTARVRAPPAGATHTVAKAAIGATARLGRWRSAIAVIGWGPDDRRGPRGQDRRSPDAGLLVVAVRRHGSTVCSVSATGTWRLRARVSLACRATWRKFVALDGDDAVHERADGGVGHDVQRRAVDDHHVCMAA